MRPIRLRPAVLIGAVAALALACGDDTLLGVAAENRVEAGLLGSGGLGSLLACNPMPAASTTQVIGPEGGTLFVGPHKLWVPEGALAAPVAITAVAPSDNVNRVVFQPEGLTFERSAWLTMSYANCGPVRWLLPKRIAYTNDLLQIIELLFSIDNPLARRVSGAVEHFSTYAIAW